MCPDSWEILAFFRKAQLIQSPINSIVGRSDGRALPTQKSIQSGPDCILLQHDDPVQALLAVSGKCDFLCVREVQGKR